MENWIRRNIPSRRVGTYPRHGLSSLSTHNCCIVCIKNLNIKTGPSGSSIKINVATYREFILVGMSIKNIYVHSILAKLGVIVEKHSLAITCGEYRSTLTHKCVSSWSAQELTDECSHLVDCQKGRRASQVNDAKMHSGTYTN